MVSTNLITFQTILTYIKKIRDENIKLYLLESYSQKPPSHISHFMKVPYKIVKKFLNCFGLTLNYTPSLHSTKRLSNRYYFSSDEKKWSLNFLIYCLENSNNLCLDLSYFIDQDKKEILKFVRNKIYGTFLDSIEKRELFDELDLEYEVKYAAFYSSIRKKGKHYVLLNKRQYALPINHFEPVVFYHKYGIQEIPSSVKESLSGKDIIDSGAFIGDSVLVLDELHPRRIYAFEPLKENIQMLRKTIELNNLKNIVIVEKGLASDKGIAHIAPVSSGSFICNFGEKIELTSIDNFVSKNSLNVGLMKFDIEGYELKAIRGAKNTIMNIKPVIIVSLYHTGKDFFEIPKLLKSWVPEYKFRFLNLNKIHATFERVLIAYC
jgi:FkbM family methyltransferase